MSALTELKRMPATKSEIASFVASAKNEILSGYENPLILEIQLKAMEEAIKLLRKDDEIKATVLNELAKYPEKSVVLHGVTFQKRMTTKYDYSKDSRWCELSAKLEAIKAQIKLHEATLQTLKEPLYNALTGEEFTPATKTSEETYSITFK